LYYRDKTRVQMFNCLTIARNNKGIVFLKILLFDIPHSYVYRTTTSFT